jgi:hypothetical protein
MTDANFQVVDRRDLGAFIPAALDDYGLDPDEFRVYCRIARRTGGGGRCWESATKLAESCRMSRRKAVYCLRILERAGMVLRTTREYQSSIYELTHDRCWVGADELPKIRALVKSGQENESDQTTAPCAAPLAQDAVPPAPCADKGTKLSYSKEEIPSNALTRSVGTADITNVCQRANTASVLPKEEKMQPEQTADSIPLPVNPIAFKRSTQEVANGSEVTKVPPPPAPKAQRRAAAVLRQAWVVAPANDR